MQCLPLISLLLLQESFGFASSKEKPAEETKKEDMNMKIIADVVQGIRQAREELVNAKS